MNRGLVFDDNPSFQGLWFFSGQAYFIFQKTSGTNFNAILQRSSDFEIQSGFCKKGISYLALRSGMNLSR